MSDAMCACNDIRFAPQDAGGGLVRESWACRACGGRFMRADDLADLRRKVRVLAGEAEDRRDYIAGLEERIAELEAERDEWRQRHALLADEVEELRGIQGELDHERSIRLTPDQMEVEDLRLEVNRFRAERNTTDDTEAYGLDAEAAARLEERRKRIAELEAELANPGRTRFCEICKAREAQLAKLRRTVESWSDRGMVLVSDVLAELDEVVSPPYVGHDDGGEFPKEPT